MAPVLLNLAPALRPWRQAGISCLLFDADQAALLNAAPDEEHKEQAQPAPPPGRAGSPRAQRAEQPFSRPSGRPAEAPAASQALSPAPPKPTTSPAHPEPATFAWDPYWQALFAKTTPHPRMVWTYPALSRDLGGDADATHRDLLRRLLTDMALPRGSHAFWPLNAYPYPQDMDRTSAEQRVDAKHFLAGIARLNPETVVLMCGRAPTELKLNAMLLTPSIIHGRRFVVTPHVDDLLSDPRRYDQLIRFLKTLIAGR